MRRLTEEDFEGVYSADDLFRLKTEQGVPLVVILGWIKDKNVTIFPWYGWARRLWESGATQGGIIADIKEAIALNRWYDKWEDIEPELLHLWPNLKD